MRTLMKFSERQFRAQIRKLLRWVPPLALGSGPSKDEGKQSPIGHSKAQSDDGKTD